jgi:hypothetical protein
LASAGYIVSDGVFGDFELEIEDCMDRPADTGIMVRATAFGAQGFQVLVRHRKCGSIGGFYGNGTRGFHALSYSVDARYDEDGRPTRQVLEDPPTTLEPATEAKRSLLRYSAPATVFFSVCGGRPGTRSVSADKETSPC